MYRLCIAWCINSLCIVCVRLAFLYVSRVLPYCAFEYLVSNLRCIMAASSPEAGMYSTFSLGGRVAAASVLRGRRRSGRGGQRSSRLRSVARWRGRHLALTNVRAQEGHVAWQHTVSDSIDGSFQLQHDFRVQREHVANRVVPDPAATRASAYCETRHPRPPHRIL